MQTFLPYPDFRVSSQVLDDRRLGKQRVETFQILRALTWRRYAWKNHPAVRMWRGFVPALVAYGLENCREWARRGYADVVAKELLAWSGGQPPEQPDLPPWFGLEPLHLSHRSALLRKDPVHYRPLFDALGNEGEPDDLPYVWPPAAFPRWPLHAGLDPLPLADAAHLLGFETVRPAQAAAVEHLVTGRDVVLVAAPGAGGSATGLLAGLAVPGRTLWVTPPPDPLAPPPPDLGPLLSPPRQRATRPSASVARGPDPEDLAAMADESRAPEFRFARADALPAAPPDLGLVVIDRLDALPDAVSRDPHLAGLCRTAPRVLAVTRPGSPPPALLSHAARVELAA